MSAVVDASFVLSLLLPNPPTLADSNFDTLVNDVAFAPALFAFEVRNTLALLERRRVLDAAERREKINLLRTCPIEVEPVPSAHTFSRIEQLAIRYQLTVYDAAYLELAVRRRLPLATLDKALRQAAEREDVALIPA